jgi:hypothetical protein
MHLSFYILCVAILVSWVGVSFSAAQGGLDEASERSVNAVGDDGASYAETMADKVTSDVGMTPYAASRASLTCSGQWKCFPYSKGVDITISKAKWVYYSKSYGDCCKKCTKKYGCWSFGFGKNSSGKKVCWMYNRIPEYDEFESNTIYNSGYIECA